jgi:hypothetical protein
VAIGVPARQRELRITAYLSAASSVTSKIATRVEPRNFLSSCDQFADDDGIQKDFMGALNLGEDLGVSSHKRGISRRVEQNAHYFHSSGSMERWAASALSNSAASCS